MVRMTGIMAKMTGRKIDYLKKDRNISNQNNKDDWDNDDNDW